MSNGRSTLNTPRRLLLSARRAIGPRGKGPDLQFLKTCSSITNRIRRQAQAPAQVHQEEEDFQGILQHTHTLRLRPRGINHHMGRTRANQ
jgi:hypothetical protein